MNNFISYRCNNYLKYVFITLTCVIFAQVVFAQVKSQSSIIVGAEQTKAYFPLLESKKIALVANQTSQIKNNHLADILLANGIQLQFVFSPEHGFRGNADAGQKITDGKDEKTGLSIISLYGRHKKPTKEDLEGIELVVFDIQDVGVRFYTYISTLHYVMEACAENHIPLLVLDRPNPNGFYIDGPVLKPEASSFVGMHQVPLVHGMTIGEYALMINGEKWLSDSINCNLMVLPCKNYTHKSNYELPIKPSPNLPNNRSIYLYPSLGLFEGTILSVGRGTPFPFQVFGHPNLKSKEFQFTPQPMYGAKHPKLNGKTCHGKDLRKIEIEEIKKTGFTLEYLIYAYSKLKSDPDFFNNFFYRLAGSHELKTQIVNGLNESEIKQTWQKDIDKFKKTRKAYLLYPDFE